MKLVAGRLSSLSAGVILVSVFCGCSEDPVRTTTTTTPRYENLTEYEHVLHNLKFAYNDMNLSRYRELIDVDAFKFFFAPDEPEANWTREQDDAATSNMFTGQQSNSPRYGKIVGIAMDLLFDNAEWDTVPEPGFEDEVWLEAIVKYEFQMDVEPDFTLINGTDARASFTVRQVFDAADNRMEWRLVRWRDLGFLNRASAQKGFVEQSTWGQVKALYQN